ncbi:MAG: hypothetical protein P8Y60_20715, partial [Calditrichota bacterium]
VHAPNPPYMYDAPEWDHLLQNFGIEGMFHHGYQPVAKENLQQSGKGNVFSQVSAGSKKYSKE